MPAREAEQPARTVDRRDGASAAPSAHQPHPKPAVGSGPSGRCYRHVGGYAESLNSARTHQVSRPRASSAVASHRATDGGGSPWSRRLRASSQRSVGGWCWPPRSHIASSTRLISGSGSGSPMGFAHPIGARNSLAFRPNPWAQNAGGEAAGQLNARSVPPRPSARPLTRAPANRGLPARRYVRRVSDPNASRLAARAQAPC